MAIVKKAVRAMKTAASVYGNYFGKVVLLGITFVFPIQLIMLFSIDMITALALPIAQEEVTLFLTIVAIVIAQIPFIYILYRDQLGEMTSLGDIYKGIKKFFTPVYVFGLLYALIVTAGYVLFIIPGIIMAILFFFFPYYTVLEGKKGFNVHIKKAANIGFDKLPNIFTVFCFVIFIEALLWWLSSNLLIFVTDGVIPEFAFLLIHVVLDVFVFPFLIFIIGAQFMDWAGIDVDEEEAYLPLNRFNGEQLN